jgi:Ca2+-binding EF-hand superfamily protein
MMKRLSTVVAVIGVLSVMIIPVSLHAAKDKERPCGPPRVPPFFAEKYDTDGDGKLSKAEEETAWKAFMEQFDTDKDGKISFEEGKAIHEAALDDFFDKADTDNDGLLTREELTAAWDKFPMGPPPPRPGDDPKKHGCPSMDREDKSGN